MHGCGYVCICQHMEVHFCVYMGILYFSVLHVNWYMSYMYKSVHIYMFVLLCAYLHDYESVCISVYTCTYVCL